MPFMQPPRAQVLRHVHGCRMTSLGWWAPAAVQAPNQRTVLSKEPQRTRWAWRQAAMVRCGRNTPNADACKEHCGCSWRWMRAAGRLCSCGRGRRARGNGGLRRAPARAPVFACNEVGGQRLCLCCIHLHCEAKGQSSSQWPHRHHSEIRTDANRWALMYVAPALLSMSDCAGSTEDGLALSDKVRWRHRATPAVQCGGTCCGRGPGPEGPKSFAAAACAALPAHGSSAASAGAVGPIRQGTKAWRKDSVVQLGGHLNLASC